jgi:RNA polymerase sigma factor (sigma-70 family)
MDKHYTEQELIEGLKSRNRGIMKHLYREYNPMIVDLVTKNSGSTDDALDVFQEGMVVLYEKAADPGFEWKSTLKTFLYAVCRNKWLMQLRKRRGKATLSLEPGFEKAADEDIHRDLIQFEKRELMRKHFKQLGDDCQKVLSMFFEGKSLREIAEVMGFAEAYSKKKKFVCQKQLIEAITTDALFKEMN